MLEPTDEVQRVTAAVHRTIAEVMVQRGLDPAGIAAEAKLSDTLGLKSMDLAQIVLTLEDELETDPFQTIPITSIRTVGDLVAAYAAALGLGSAAPGAQDMAAEMAAARARRSGRRR